MPQKQKKGKKKQRHVLRYVGVVIAVLLLIGAPLYYYNYGALRAPALPDPPLKDLAAAHGVELSLLTSPSRLDVDVYKQIHASEFSAVTTDGTIHWDKFRPSPTEYDFSDLDKIMAFAEAHNMPVQAHHLVWPEDDSLPEWLKEGDYTKEQLMEIIHDHIKTVVGRYKGRIAEWTVVNEPFTREKYLWDLDNWWADKLGGTEYIEQAFRWAHEADPTAKLILNDFYNESRSFASDAQYEYMKAAKARGVPIHGIGMQIHVDASRPPKKAEMIENMRRFKDLGYPTYITEFDVSSETVEGSAEYKERLEAEVAAEVVRACIESKSCVSFTVFGLKDNRSIVKWSAHAKKRSYMFTRRYQTRPMFDSFRAAWENP